MKTHNTSFHKCVLCICNNCDYENRKGFIICHQWAKHENEILTNRTKHLNSFIKGDLGDGKDLCHVTLVSDDGKQLINKSLLHIVHLTIWWNIFESCKLSLSKSLNSRMRQKTHITGLSTRNQVLYSWLIFYF